MYNIINKLVIHRTLLIKRIMQIFVQGKFKNFSKIKQENKKVYNIYDK